MLPSRLSLTLSSHTQALSSRFSYVIPLRTLRTLEVRWHQPSLLLHSCNFADRGNFNLDVRRSFARAKKAKEQKLDTPAPTSESGLAATSPAPPVASSHAPADSNSPQPEAAGSEADNKTEETKGKKAKRKTKAREPAGEEGDKSDKKTTRKRKPRKILPDLDTSEYIDPKTVELRDTTPEAPSAPAPLKEVAPGVTPVNLNNFKEVVLDSKSPTVLYFYKLWDEKTQKFMEEIQRNNNTVVFAGVDMNDPYNLRLSESFQVDLQTGPHFFGLSDGTLVYEQPAKKVDSLLPLVPNVLEAIAAPQKSSTSQISENKSQNNGGYEIAEVAGEIRIFKQPKYDFVSMPKLGVLLKDILAAEAKEHEAPAEPPAPAQPKAKQATEEDDEDDDEVEEYSEEEEESDIYYDDEPEQGDIATFWFNAIQSGDLEGLKDLAEEYGSKIEFDIPADYFFTTPLDRSPENNITGTSLHIAAGNGQLEVVKFLVEQFGVQPNIQNSGKTPAFTAALRGHLDVLKYLKSKDVDLAESISLGSLLHAATLGGHNDVLRYLVEEEGLSVNELDERQCLPLHYAARTGNWEAVNILIDAGSKDCLDKYADSTALLLAVTENASKLDVPTLKKLAKLDLMETQANWTPRFSKNIDTCFEVIRRATIPADQQVEVMKVLLARKYSDGINKFPAHGFALFNALKYQKADPVRHFAFDNTSFAID